MMQDLGWRVRSGGWQPLAQQGSSLPLGQQENLPRITEPQGERASVTLLSPTG